MLGSASSFGLSGGLVAADGYVSISDWILKTPPNNLEVRIFNQSDGSAVSETGPFGVASAADGLLYAYSSAAPAYAWINPASGALVVYPAPFLGPVSDQLAVGVVGQEVDAADPRTGVALWKAPLPAGTTPSSTQIAGTLVYVAGTDGTTSTLYAFDAATGTQVAAVPIVGGGSTATPLVIAEGTVFVTVNGTITAYAPTA
jgi:outer membrane protein assembly factor BamB